MGERGDTPAWRAQSRSELTAQSHPGQSTVPCWSLSILAELLFPWLGHCQLTLTKGDSPKEALRLCLTLNEQIWAHNHRAELRTAPLPK